MLPENLDRFLQKVRGLGELKNQTLGTEDVTKAYLDTDARLKNARVMEQRLIDMLKTKTGKVSDLLQVEKELGRGARRNRKDAGRIEVLGFAGAIRHSDDFTRGKRHGRTGGVSALKSALNSRFMHRTWRRRDMRSKRWRRPAVAGCRSQMRSSIAIIQDTSLGRSAC